MAGETVITVIGNLTADPELRTIGSGASVASFTIASTPRTFNRQSGQWEDGQALFLRCSAWRELADHCAQSLSKGMRVIAQGRSARIRRTTAPTVPSWSCRSTRSARRCVTPPPKSTVRAPALRVAIVAASAATTAAVSRAMADTRVVPDIPAARPIRAVDTRVALPRRPLPLSPHPLLTRGAMPVPAPPSRRSAPPPISAASPTNPSSNPSR